MIEDLLFTINEAVPNHFFSTLFSIFSSSRKATFSIWRLKSPAILPAMEWWSDGVRRWTSNIECSTSTIESLRGEHEKENISTFYAAIENWYMFQNSYNNSIRRNWTLPAASRGEGSPYGWKSIFSSLANPAASGGECARYRGSSDTTGSIIIGLFPLVRRLRKVRMCSGVTWSVGQSLNSLIYRSKIAW